MSDGKFTAKDVEFTFEGLTLTSPPRIVERVFDTEAERDAWVTARDARDAEARAIVEDLRAHKAQVAIEEIVRGRHFVEWIPTLDAWRKEGRDHESIKLLLEIIWATERPEVARKFDYPPAYTKRAAIIFRKRGEYDNEIAILERYNRNAKKPDPTFEARIAKAQQLREKSR